MLQYSGKYKNFSRDLRKNMTRAEIILWQHLRRKKLYEVQFYRQKIIGQYIVDFYAPQIHLIIEVDGGQHFDDAYLKKDADRDLVLNNLGYAVKRFDNIAVLTALDYVIEDISHYIEIYLETNPPGTSSPAPLFQRGIVKLSKTGEK